jgi:hypothetical protein
MHIFLSDYWWQRSDIWSQASYTCRYPISWEAFLDPSDSYFLFADFVVFYTHWTYILYMPIFSRIFLSNYWWQKSDIWSQASYRYPIWWEASFDPSDSYFLFAEERGYHKWALAHSSSCFLLFLSYDYNACITSNTTGPSSSKPAYGEVYSKQHYVIKFVSDLWQVGGFLQVLRFPPSIKLTATIWLKASLNTLTLVIIGKEDWNG